MKITIIDYKMSNLYSVKHACDFVGLNAVISSDKDDLIACDAAILPGVGAFKEAMRNMESLDLVAPLLEHIQQGKPLLGICLGMQLLFDESEEFGNHKGLGIIEGSVKKFPAEYQSVQLRVPQIGWNRIFSTEASTENWDDALLKGVKNGEFMYFVHSYYVDTKNSSEIISMTNYEGFEYCSGIKKGNITAFQFHPEKSSKEGIKIYKNFKNSLTKDDH